MKRLSSSLSVALTLASVLMAPMAQAATISPSDLIKASGAAVYYYAQDGKRYVFPTEKTYKSWYSDFSSVRTITDSELSLIPIGGNVTYRPGTRLLKITTDPRTYAVDGKQLRWIKTEEVAKALWGNDWAKQVDDLADPFFINYKLGTDINQTSDFSPSSAQSTYSTIQSTISASAPSTPTTPVPTPTPTPTSTTPVVNISLDKATAQINETIFVSASTTYAGSINKLEIFADNILLTSCSGKTCTGTWMVPTVGVKSSYAFRTTLTTSDTQTVEQTATVTIISQPSSASIKLTADRTTIKPNQYPNIRAVIGAGLNASRTDIFVDGTSVKACAVTPNDCTYADYITGPLNSTHTVYALVTTPANLQYRSSDLIITIANNDTPFITLSPSISNIYPGQTVDLTISAQDDDGIAQLSILKDGQILKNCLGAAPCTVTTGPWNVASGSILTFSGTASDLQHATSTAVTTVQVY